MRLWLGLLLWSMRWGRGWNLPGRFLDEDGWCALSSRFGGVFNGCGMMGVYGKRV